MAHPSSAGSRPVSNLVLERYPVEGDGECVRLSCCVPFCRRTFRNDKKGTPWPKGSIIMCGKHWRMAPAEMRANDKRLRRMLRNIGRLVPSPKARRMWDLVARWHNENWERARKAIVERAAGIG